MDGELQRTVGRNIRRIRATRGLSQEELAELIGNHRTYVGSVERGERNLSLRSLERLADSLGVDPVALLAPPEHGEPGPGEPGPGAPEPGDAEPAEPTPGAPGPGDADRAPRGPAAS
ncbi:helix-turn-helix domain-containing protein [Cellulomonas sp. ACRRI]|uniref:helix-turn-helix domain-containing protein n=1 Tax=Cellulomonas sp. ACRRI TaxID=2918188 RepID=UPI001EF308C3|nr:helix-turn-helix transcriptional regulator [Cellulomonas sp. ACRRI]MCG7287604.1 helix-turn-helix domain-containing protein [Cellulomonas sp. ACRRI]